MSGPNSEGRESMLSMLSRLQFDAPSRGDWEAQVARALRGEPLESLVTYSDDGIAIQPLYTEELCPTAGDPAGLPGAAPFTRGPYAEPRPWELRQRHDLADPAATGAAIRADVAGGVSSIWLRLQRPPAPGELLAALGSVNPAITAVAVDGGPWYAAAAEATEALAAAVPGGRLAVTADPLGALARHGFLLREPAEALAQLSPLVAAAERSRPHNPPGTPSTSLAAGLPAAAEGSRLRHRAGCGNGSGGDGIGAAPTPRVVTVDTTVYADAGASPALELAYLLATGVAYLRALEAGSIDLSVAARHIEARLAATADQFATIAKFRAARTLWDGVLEACGVPAAERVPLRCWAVTSEAMAAARDPFVNLVRATTAGFAAVAGGAECLTVLPHDIAIGLPGERGRRLARNISHLLADEARLGAVADPAGGSWYTEDRTARLAEAAWQRFGEVEAAGGMPAGLLDGSIAAAVDSAWRRRCERLESGAEQVVGVTCFPPPGADAAEDSPGNSAGGTAGEIEASAPSAAGQAAGSPVAPSPPAAPARPAALAAPAPSTASTCSPAPSDAFVSVAPLPLRRPNPRSSGEDAS